MAFLSSRLIYRAAEPYDETAPQFDCLAPVDSGDYWAVDCWVCDAEGNVHPGYSVAGVPVQAAGILEPVANAPMAMLASARDWEGGR